MGTLTIPNIFTANTKAESGKVNGNFSAIKTAYETKLDEVTENFKCYEEVTSIISTGANILDYPINLVENFTITGVKAVQKVAPSGGSNVYDIKKNGTTIFPSAAKPTITTGAVESSWCVPNVTSCSIDDKMTADVVATANSGSRVKVLIKGYHRK